MSDVAIKVDKVSKSFKLPHEKVNSIKSVFVGLFNGKRTYEKQEVLKDISFEIKKGEFFGIVGRNGSGKSTLLKLMAGIYSPDQGAIQVNGKLTPFIELGVGFNPELTGRENVYLNGALLGFNRTEIGEMYDEIVGFSELENFMDQKLKNYSSGMQVRLAFSIAIRAKSAILLIDEVLAVGDAAFQAKCFDIFTELKKQKRTLILVTHDMNSVLRFCDRTMLVHDGDIVEIGKPTKIADDYLKLNYENNNLSKADRDAYIEDVKLIQHQNKNREDLKKFKDLEIVAQVQNKNNEALHFGVQIFNEAGAYCFGTNTKISGLETTKQKISNVNLKIYNANLLADSYFITIAVMNENATKVLQYLPKELSFRVAKNSEYEGIMMLDHKWSIKGV